MKNEMQIWDEWKPCIADLGLDACVLNAMSEYATQFKRTANADLIVSFPDQSKSFTYGVEFGRLLQKIEQGDDVVMNNGFPVRIENKEVIERTCRTYGYIPTFGRTQYEGWIEFIAIRKSSSDN